MALSSKKGIRIASPFKLHAKFPLDVREQVDTLAERDELVTSNAVTEGLRCWVKSENTLYVWNGKEWLEWVKTKQDKNVHFDMFGSNQVPVNVYGGDSTGQGLSVGASGTVIVGSGSTKSALEKEVGATDGRLVLASDSDIDFYVNNKTKRAGIKLSKDLNFYPMVNDTGTIGTPTNKFNHIYSTNLDITNITGENAKFDHVTPSKDNFGNVGAADKKYTDIYGVNFHGTKGDITTVNSTTGNITNVNSTNVKTTDTQSLTVHPETNNTGSVGTAEKWYKDIYGTNFHGTSGTITNITSTNTTSVNNTLTNVDPPTNGTGHLGSTGKRYADVFSNNFTGTNGNITNVTSTNITADDADLNVIHPGEDDTGSVGTAEERYADIYGVNYHGTNADITNVKSTDTQSATVHPATNNSGSVGTVGSYYKDIYGTNLHSTTGDITNVNSTNVKTTDTQSLTVHPETTNTGSVGTVEKYYKDIYGTTYHGTTGNITNMNSTNTTSVNNTLTNVDPPTNSTGHLGSTDKRYKDVFSDNFTGTNAYIENMAVEDADLNVVHPDEDNTGSVGTADIRYADIYGVNYHGTKGDITTLNSTTGNITNVNSTNVKSTNGTIDHVLPSKDNSGNVGSSTSRYADIYGVNFHGTTGNITNVNSTNVKTTDTQSETVHPATNNTGSLGTAEKYYKDAYATNLHSSNGSITTLTSTTGNITNVNATNVKTTDTQSSTVHPAETNTGSLGTAEKYYKDTYSTNYHGTTGDITTLNSTTGNITNVNSTNIKSTNATLDKIVPSKAGTGSIGTADSKFSDIYATNFHGTSGIFDTLTATSIDADINGDLTGNVHGNADTASKLTPGHKINTTLFDGSGDITTATWGASRKITISDGTNSGTATAVNGGADVTLPLPATIKATFVGNITGNVTGNAATATKFAATHKINGTAFDGSGDITTTTWGASRKIAITDADATNSGTATAVNGGADVSIPLPANIKATTFTGALNGNAATATKVNKTLTFTGGVSTSFNGSADVSVAIPTTLKNPTALKIQLNGGTSEGSNQFTYDGSAAKTVNITAANVGASASNHTHNYAGSSSAGGAATSANKVNAALKVQLNGGTAEGTTQFTFDGSAAKTVNITAANVGASASNHTHNYAGASHTHANLALQFNGTTKVTYNGGTAQTFNVTPAAIGAAATSHTHNYAGSSSAGGAATSLVYFKSTSNANVGIDTTDANAVAYVSGLTGLLASDGAIYKQVYSSAWVHEIYGDYRTGQIQIRGKNNNTWQPWRTVLDSSNYSNYAAAKSHTHANLALQFNGTTKVTYNGGSAQTLNITPAAIGAAASSHTHNYAGSSSAGGVATSAAKVNTNLIIKLNGGGTEGTNLFTFNGSAAKTVNITASSIGAAASGHTHASSAVAMPVGTIMFSTSSTATFFQSTMGGTWEVVGNIQALVGASTTLTLYMFKKTKA